MRTNNRLFLIWVIIWVVLSYCFWHDSQLSVSQSHLMSVLIQMNCFHFPFLKCSRARLLEDFSFAFIHFALLFAFFGGGYFLHVEKCSADWLNVTPQTAGIQEWPIDHVCLPHLKCLLKGRFVGLVIFWYMLNFKTAAPETCQVQCLLASEIYWYSSF